MEAKLNEIKGFLGIIYDKISKPATISVGIEFFKKLIKESIDSKKEMSFILHDIYNYIKLLSGIEKKEALYLLPFIYHRVCNISKSLPYLNKTYQMIQISITRETEQIYSFIAGILGEIFDIIFLQSHNQMTNEELFKSFEEANAFCSFLINSVNNIPYQICGCLFFNKLIETSGIVYSVKEILQDLIKAIFDHLDTKKKFYPRKEMLQCLQGVIQYANEAINPFVDVLISKIMLYLKDSICVNKKIVLNCLFILANTYKDKIISSKNTINEVLCRLKEDKVKDIRIASMKILKIINEGEMIRAFSNTYSSFHKRDLSQSIRMIDRDKGKYTKSQRSKGNVTEEKEKHKEKGKAFVLVEKHNKDFIKNKTVPRDSNHNQLDESINMITYQMRDIFKQQQLLARMVDNLKLKFNKSVNDINKRATQIENTIDQIEKMNQSSIINSQWNQIVHSIHQGFIDEAFNQSIDNDYLLIKLIKYINKNKIKLISSALLDEVMSRLIVLMNIKKHNEDIQECIDKIYQETYDKHKKYVKDAIVKIANYRRNRLID